ncbi:monofunctional biosynthetic peptidoglycan transglycosylase [Gemmatimonas sp.]|uniref:monofunctional biosynthetic peptidoglycan transglycosylase n=1 Tax=Gemmatimonas sp. TaxID=1962908 RepID=UPI0022BFCBF2|nr:monofunctional biosynthetic peptidoglycan transglycosylase [Gemmatimonas sp.]MCZ8203582.1 monofunctional biosynthetic peptidoglycan transglycosylase [Gemmatimonas sp.]
MRVFPRRGNATGRARRSWLVRLLRALLLVALAPVPFILLFAVVNPPVTMVMIGRAAQRFAAGESPAWPVHTPVARSEMSPSLRRAVLASEDDRFYLHNGIDFVELDKALERRKRGGKLRGASTLTQQVAKNIFLWNGRSFVRKGVEAYLTLWLELLLTKERILDLYINLAEWGPYHFGAEAGARYHFRKSAASLTREESARMAAILPAPRRWAPRGSVASRRIGAILQRMQYAPPKTEQAK